MNVSKLAARLSAVLGQTVVEASGRSSTNSSTTFVIYRAHPDASLQLLAVFPGGSTETVWCHSDEREETHTYHAFHELVSAIEGYAWPLVVFSFEKPATADIPAKIAADAPAPIALPPEGEVTFVRDHLVMLDHDVVSITILRDTSIDGAYFAVTSDAIDLNATDKIYSPYTGRFVPMVGFK